MVWLVSRRGVADQRPAADAAGRGQERPGAGAFHQGRLVMLARRMPQGGHLPDAQDAALSEESRSGGVQVGQGDHRPDVAHPEPRPGGMVVVAVGGGHRLQDFPSPLLPGAVGKDGDDLELGVEGNAAHLLLDQQGIVNAAADLLPAPPAPARDDEPEHGTGAQQRRIEKLPVLHPQVAFEGGQRPHAQHGHGDAVQLQGPGLVGVGGVGPLLAGVFESLLLVGLGPVGAQGAQQQAGQHPFAGAQGGEGADDRQQGIGARVQQVVVPEGAQGHVVGAAGAEGQTPGLLAHVDEDGVLVHGYLPDAGLGVMGRELAAYHPVVLAAGQQGHAVGGARQLQGEGFGDGDGLEQVLHSQQGPLAGARRRHRQQHRRFLRLSLAEENVLQVRIQIDCLLMGLSQRV